jgi:hypothetical protein
MRGRYAVVRQWIAMTLMGGSALVARGADDYDITAARVETVTVIATGVSNMTAASSGDVSQEQL